MAEQEKIIKEDCNFLEWPMFVLDDKEQPQQLLIEKGDGKYEISCSIGLPDFFDKKVLYCLLQELYEKTRLQSYSITTTRYKLAKGISKNTPGKKQYDNLMTALKKWAALTINFDGIFYENGHHITKIFHIIDTVFFDHKTGKVMVRFNKEYVDQLNSSQFYKIIDFHKYRTFTRATSARLYELLVKNFMGRDIWTINIKILASKLGLKKHPDSANYYRSDIIRQLKPCITEINSRTDLYVDLILKADSDICVFKQLEKQKEYIPAIAVGKTKKKSQTKHIDKCYEQFSNLPQDERDRISTIIERDPYLIVFPDEKSKVYAFMKRANMYPA